LTFVLSDFIMELRRAGGGRGTHVGLRRRIALRAVHLDRPEGDPIETICHRTAAACRLRA
jgi:hypothetical protein